MDMPELPFLPHQMHSPPFPFASPLPPLDFSLRSSAYSALSAFVLQRQTVGQRHLLSLVETRRAQSTQRTAEFSPFKSRHPDTHHSTSAPDVKEWAKSNFGVTRKECRSPFKSLRRSTKLAARPLRLQTQHADHIRRRLPEWKEMRQRGCVWAGARGDARSVKHGWTRGLIAQVLSMLSTQNTIRRFRRWRCRHPARPLRRESSGDDELDR